MGNTDAVINDPSDAVRRRHLSALRAGRNALDDGLTGQQE